LAHARKVGAGSGSANAALRICRKILQITLTNKEHFLRTSPIMRIKPLGKHGGKRFDGFVVKRLDGTRVRISKGTLHPN
jgi:hypothetical protein